MNTSLIKLSFLTKNNKFFPIMGDEFNCYYKLYGNLIMEVPHYRKMVYGE